MAQVNLKIIHKNSSEARRSLIDATDSRNFEAVRRKIQGIFPNLCGSSFKVFWKDGDGDQITITGDEDLVIAFSEMSSETKVLYVENEAGCPFADPSHLNALKGMAQQYLGPWRTTLGADNAQKFVEMLRNASDGFFGAGNTRPRSPESGTKTESPVGLPNLTDGAEERIQKGLKRLQEMGFRDDHGFMRKTLEQFDGNVESVLKILSK